jgi:hypothetical protein
MGDVMNDQKSKQLVRTEQDSLAPIALDRLSVEDEAALMQRGKLGRLSSLAFLAVMLGAGATFWMKTIDAREAYVGAAARVSELRTSALEPFLRCALPQTDRASINSKARLISALETYGDRFGKDYSRTLSRCAPILAELPAELARIKAPHDVQEQLARLSSSASDLAAAFGGYRSYLSSAGKSYDYVQALPMMEKIAIAWETYEARQAELHAQVQAAVD